MSSIHFFTGENSITQIQQPDFAFGKISDLGNEERYNLENKFSVDTSSPAFAVCKSLILAIEDSSNSNVLNIALLPLNTYTAGFPISLFIYRGILKSSLIDSSGNIEEEDTSWASSNILQIIKSLQNKINQKNGTSDTADFNSLGIQFTNAPNETYIESIFFNDINDFHPLIVPGGCQIGKFEGGNTSAAFEIILDRIGSETKLEILKASEHIFSIDKLDLSGLSPKEQLKEKFINRNSKEYILTFLDLTAFYGSCKNNKISISGINNNDDTFLENFSNKNCVYIDIRDERGFSFNHFFKLGDDIDVGFHTNNPNNEVVYNNGDYYEDWPILKLSDREYNPADIEQFYIKIPIVIGLSENLNLLTSFTGGVSVNNQKDTKNHHHVLTLQKIDGTIPLKKSEPIALSNWHYSDNKLGANYFLMKKSVSKALLDKEYTDSVWNSYFSLKMQNIFEVSNIVDGEYRIKVYAPFNSPLIANTKNNELFMPITGLAVDKFHITFFAYYDESVYNESSNRFISSIKILGTGKFKIPLSADEVNYNPIDKGLGFLHQLVKQSVINNYTLSKYSYEDVSNGSVIQNFLSYTRKEGDRPSDILFDNFHAITFTHEEYNTLKAKEQTGFANPDYISKHHLYVTGKSPQMDLYNRFKILKSEVSLSAPKLITTDQNEYSLDLAEIEEDVLVNGDPIEITGSLLT